MNVATEVQTQATTQTGLPKTQKTRKKQHWTQLPPETIHRNLQLVFNRCTPWELTTGKQYYTKQQQLLCEIADKWDFKGRETIGAFAALSPNNSEAMTYRALLQLIRRVRFGSTNRVVAYGQNILKAMRILNGADPLSVLSGNKVTAFYLNTLCPWDDHVLTIDGHIAGVCFGQRLRMKEVPDINDESYRYLCGCIRDFARNKNWYGTEIQATLWLTWKRIHSVLPPVQTTQIELPFSNWERV